MDTVLGGGASRAEGNISAGILGAAGSVASLFPK